VFLLLALAPCLAEAQEDVRVRGEALERGSRDRDSAGSVIRGARLRAPGSTASDVLRSETGVSVSETGGHGALSTAQIRGATSAQTPVHLAGIRLNDDLTGSADLSLVPLWLISRVEVYRGNAPIAADPWGIGGAIFFEPRRPQTSELGLGLLRGSFGTRGAWLRAGIGDGKSAALFGIRAESAENAYSYLDDGGTRFDAADDRARTRTNANTASIDSWALANVHVDQDTDVQVLAHELSREQGVPGLARIANREARVRSRRSLYGARGRSRCGVHCDITTSVNVLRTRSVLDDPLRELALGGARAQIEGSRAETSVLLENAWPERFDSALHVRASHDRVRAAIQDGSDTGGDRASGRVAASVSARLETEHALRVKLLASLEGIRTTDANLQQRPGSVLVPAVRGTFSAHLGELRVLANASRTYRVPTLGELYGISGAVRGNAELRRETGAAAELGLLHPAFKLFREVHLEASAFIFGRLSSDLIAYRRSSLGYVTPYNVASARTVGAESDVAMTVSGLALHMGASFFSPSDTSSEGFDRILPFQSRMILTPRIELRVPKLTELGIERGVFSVAYPYQSSRFADPAGLLVIPAQGNLTASLELELARSHLRWGLRGTNLAREQRFDTIGFPLPERAFYTSLEAML
jgi:vitamin B12 transporter